MTTALIVTEPIRRTSFHWKSKCSLKAVMKAKHLGTQLTAFFSTPADNLSLGRSSSGRSVSDVNVLVTNAHKIERMPGANRSGCWKSGTFDLLPNLFIQIIACNLWEFRTFSWQLYTKTKSRPKQARVSQPSGKTIKAGQIKKKSRSVIRLAKFIGDQCLNCHCKRR